MEILKTEGYCDWRVDHEMEIKILKEDVPESLHLAPGTRIKYRHPSLTSTHHRVMVTKKVTVVKEFPLYFLVDFGNYLSTINKNELLMCDVGIEKKKKKVAL